MNANRRLLFSATILGFVTNLYAFQVPPQPTKCPAVVNIQKTSFISAKKFNDGSYGSFQLGTYDTQDTWAFIVAHIPASSTQDAVSKAETALKSLSFYSGPQYFAQHNLWACFYDISSGYQAITVTPLPTATLNADPIFKLIHS